MLIINDMKKIIFMALAFLAVLSCSTSHPQAVIFDTDMGNDVDDALALAMLYRYSDEGKAKVLGIAVNKNDIASAEFIDIVSTYYGYGDTPIGVAAKPVDTSADGVNQNGMNFVTAVSKMDFPRTVKDYSSLPSAVQLYRRLLSAQPDHSVVIISVGFSTNLAALLDSPADDISPLSGRELLEKKVKCVSSMAGNFRKEGEGRFAEYNVVRDVPSARKFFAECPVNIVVSPFELGDELHFPAAEVEKNFGYEGPNPVAEAYKAYLPMPFDRPIWDLTSVLYGIEGNRFFRQSGLGKVEVDEQGLTTFCAHPTGRDIILSVDKVRHQEVIDRCVQLLKAE